MIKYRHWGHWVAGAIIPTSYLLSPALPPTLAFLFVAYQIAQYHIKKDKLHLDILETMVMAFITTGGLLIWRLIW